MQGRVLIVDDEPTILFTWAKILMGCGLTVVTAASAQAAKDALALDSFDLVITDQSMESAQAGFELADLVMARSPETAVIIISGYPQLSNNWQEHGIRAVLGKPVPVPKLLSTIEEVSNRATAESAVVKEARHVDLSKKPPQSETSRIPGALPRDGGTDKSPRL